MFIQNFGKIDELKFYTMKEMDIEQAEEYAMQQLQNGRYNNCTIGKVYVNEELVLEDVKTF